MNNLESRFTPARDWCPHPEYWHSPDSEATEIEVSEFIGGLSLAMSLEATALDISNAIFPHPTLSEVIKEAAHAVEGQAIHI